MPFRAKYNQPWKWDRKQKKKAAMRLYHILLHPTTYELMWEVRTMYGLYYNRKFDHSKTLRHALQNANLNVRKCLKDKGIDPEPALALTRAKLAAKRGASIEENDPTGFEGVANVGSIDVG